MTGQGKVHSVSVYRQRHLGEKGGPTDTATAAVSTASWVNLTPWGCRAWGVRSQGGAGREAGIPSPGKKCTLAYVTYFNPNEFFKILQRRRLDSLDWKKMQRLPDFMFGPSLVVIQTFTLNLWLVHNNHYHESIWKQINTIVNSWIFEQMKDIRNTNNVKIAHYPDILLYIFT